MDVVFIAYITEPYEPSRRIGVFTTPALAHRAIADWLESEDRSDVGGYVDEATVYSTPIPR